MEKSTSTKSSPSLSEGLHLGELVQIIKLRRNLLYLFTVLSILGTVFRQLFYVPIYTADSVLSVTKAENNPMQVALGNLGTSSFDTPDRLKKYTDYIQSNDFYVAVAETLKFQEGYHLLNLTSPSEMSFTHKKFWKQYLATHFGRKQAVRTDIPEPVLVPVEQLADILKNVTLPDASTSDTITIHITTLDPFTSMVLANTTAEVFAKKTSERDYNEVSEVKRFIQEQLESTTERLKRSEGTLIEFKKTHNILSVSSENMAYSGKLSSIESELEAAKLKYQQNSKLIEFYEGKLSASETKLLTQGSAALRDSHVGEIARLRQQIDSLRYKKTLMQAQGYSESSWQMGQINTDLDKVAASLKEQLALAAPKTDTHIAGTQDVDDEIVRPDIIRTKLSKLKEENRELEAKIATSEKSRALVVKSGLGLPKDEQVLLTLSRDVDLQFELYSSLKKKLQEIEIQQVALQSHVMVSDRAGLPPPQPRTNFIVKILFALLVGLFLGCSSAFLLEAMDPSVKHISDLERMELLSLGSIPHVEGSQIRRSIGGRSFRPDLLICKEKPESTEAMAFKHVRAQIVNLRGSDGNAVKMITITSPERGDGKSFIASNLAVSLSQLEKKTLLIDGDFRNPSVPLLFGYKDGNGLSSLLTLKASLDEVLLKDRAPYLDILPAGWAPPNPSELISNEKFRVLLDYLRSSYDYIVVDAPPAIAVVDASVLANLSDTVIMTAGFRRTKKEAVIMALRRILQVSHKNVYAILNNVWDSNAENRDFSQTSNHAASETAVDDALSRIELEKFERDLKGRKAG